MNARVAPPLPESIRREFLTHIEATLGLTFSDDEPFFAGSSGTQPWKATPIEDDDLDKFWYRVFDAPAWRAVYGHYRLDGGKDGNHWWNSAAVGLLGAAERRELQAQNRQAAEQRKREAAQHARASRDRVFAEYENRAAPADLAFPYLVKKRFDAVPPGTKVTMHRALTGEKDGATGRPARGAPSPALMVPLRRLGSEELTSCEYIPAHDSSKKETAWGIPKDGDCYIFGEYPAGRMLGDASPIYFAEGLASAEIAHRLTRHMSVRCGSAGDIEKVLRDARRVYGAAALLVVLAERGNGNEQAQRAAAKHGAAVVEMPFAEDDQGTDVWDYWNLHGDATTSAVLRNPSAPAPLVNEGGAAQRAWVDTVNAEGYFVGMDWGGRPVLGRTSDGRVLTFNKSELEIALRNRRPPGVDQVPHLYWLGHPARREYRRVAYDPEGRNLDKELDLNLWRGWAVAPAPGDWGRLRAHIRENVCGSDPVLFDWFLGWMATIVQRPGRPCGVAPVLVGDEGAGKGTVLNAMLHLFGRHGLHLNRTDQLAGQFTEHLEGVSFVFCDEIGWANDHALRNALWTLVTEPDLHVHPKGRKPYQVANCLNFALATNRDHAVSLTKNARRYCVIHVRDPVGHLDGAAKAQARREYFKPIYDELTAGGYAAMLHDLHARVLTGFDVAAFPRTAAMREQVELSLDSFDRWLLNCARDGLIGLSDWPSERPMEKYLVLAAYREFTRQANERYPLNDIAFWRKMTGIFGREMQEVQKNVKVATMHDVAAPNEASRLPLKPGADGRARVRAVALPPPDRAIEIVETRLLGSRDGR